jgi:hypothetical protein
MTSASFAPKQNRLSSPASTSDSECEGVRSGSVRTTQVFDTVTVVLTWVVRTRLSLSLKIYELPSRSCGFARPGMTSGAAARVRAMLDPE